MPRKLDPIESLTRLVGVAIVAVGLLAGAQAHADVLADGDLNGDTYLTSADVLLLTRIIAKEITPTEAQKVRGDVAPRNKPANEPHVLNAADVLVLSNAVAGGANGDFDGDLVSNHNELVNGTNPFAADTDGDGILDGAESGHTNPLIPDVDGDGWDDGTHDNTLNSPCTGPALPAPNAACDDNCPFTANSNQRDSNGDSVGDACQCGDLSGDGFVTSGDLVPYVNYLSAHPGGGPIGSAGAPPRCDVNGDDLCNQADYDLLSTKLSAGTVQDLKSVVSCSDPRHMPLAQNPTPYPDQIPTNILGDIQSFSSQPPAWNETLVNTVDHFYADPIASRDNGSWLRSIVSPTTAPGIEANTPVWSLIDSFDRSEAMNTHDWLEQRGIFSDVAGGQEYNETFGFVQWDFSTNPKTVRRTGARQYFATHGILHDVQGNCVIDNFSPLVLVNQDCSLVDPAGPDTDYSISNLAPRWSTVMDYTWQTLPITANATSQDNLSAGPVGGTGRNFEGRFDGFEIQQFIKYLEVTGRQHDNFWAPYHAMAGNQGMLAYLHARPSVMTPANASLYDDVRLSINSVNSAAISRNLTNDPVLREYHLWRHLAHLRQLIRYYQRAKALQLTRGRSPLGFDVHGNGAPLGAYATMMSEVVDDIWGEYGNVALNEVVQRRAISGNSALRLFIGQAIARGRKPVLYLNQWFPPWDDPSISVGYIDMDWAEQSAKGANLYAGAGYIDHLGRADLRARLAAYLAFRDLNRGIYEQRARSNPAEVALIVSVPTVLNNGWGGGSIAEQEQNISAAARALEEAHIPYEVIIFDHPEASRDLLTLADLRKYKVLVAPTVLDVSKRHACFLYDYLAGRDYVAGSENTSECLNPTSGSPVVPQGALVVIGTFGTFDESHAQRTGGTTPELLTKLRDAFPSRVKRPLNPLPPPPNPPPTATDFPWWAGQNSASDMTNQLNLLLVSIDVASYLGTPMVQLEANNPQHPNPYNYKLLWTSVFVHALDPLITPVTKDFVSVHFLRYDPITTRVGGDPNGSVIASIAPTYSVIDQTKLTLRLPPGLNTSGGLEAWWLSPGLAAQQITGPANLSCTPTSCVVVLPMSGSTADLNSYKVLVLGASGALTKSNALRRGDRYLLRAGYAGAKLNSPPVLDGIAAQRSVTNAASYLAAARTALLNAGAGREQEQSDRETAYQTKPTGPDVVRAFRFNQKVQNPDWEYVNPAGTFNGSFGWLPSTDGSTETVGEINFGGDGQLANFDQIRFGGTPWPLHLNPDPTIFGELSGKSRTFAAVLPSAGTYQFELILTAETFHDLVGSMIRLNGKPVTLDSPPQLGGLTRVSFKATVPNPIVNLTFGGAANFGVSYLTIRTAASADPVDPLDTYGLRDWMVSPRRSNPEWWPMANSPCNDDVYSLADPSRTGWVKPLVSPTGIPLVDLGPPQHAEIGDIAYAVTDLWRQVPSTEYLSIGASSGAVVCLNGVQVAEVPNSNGVVKNEIKASLNLAAGKNVLVVKLERFWERRWMFYASVTPTPLN